MEKKKKKKKSYPKKKICIENDPCLNGGVCVQSESGSGYICNCPTGYSGTNCENEGNDQTRLSLPFLFIFVFYFCFCFVLLGEGGGGGALGVVAGKVIYDKILC